MKRTRHSLTPLLLLLAWLLLGWPLTSQAADDRIAGVDVQGVERISPDTVRSYLTVQEGDAFTSNALRESLRRLYDTGFFKDVTFSREGDRLVVRVQENPMIFELKFSGNEAYDDDELKELIQVKEGETYDRAKAERDLAVLRQAFRIKGLFLAKVELKVEELSQNRIRLTYRIEEGEQSKVRAVRVVGNDHIPTKELSKKLMIQPSDWLSWFSEKDTYDREKLLYDQEQLRNHYLDNGYARVKVYSSVAELTPDQRAFVVTHTVQEGDLYRFGEVIVDSDFDEAPEAMLRQQLVTWQGDIYSRDQVRQSIENLTDLVGDYGYAFVDVSPETRINDEQQTVDLVYHVSKGKRVYLNRIEVRGNTRTRDEVLRREVQLVEGDRFSTAKVRKSKERLKALNFFENIEITNPPSEAYPDRVDILIDVEEKPTGAFTIGAGFSSYDKVLGTASISQNNFMGRGQKLSLSFTLSARTSDFDIGFVEPYLMGKRVAGGLNVFNRKQDRSSISSYKQSSFGGSGSLGFPLTEELYDRVSYSLIHVELTNTANVVTNPAVQSQLDRSPYLQSMVSNQLTWNDIDDPMMPTNGARHRLTTDLSGLGGDVRFLRLVTDHSLYRPLFERSKLVGHLRGRLGYIHGIGEDVPLFERFYLGGAHSLRGFDNAGIGPRTLDGDAYGGTLFEQVNAELLFPVFGLEDKGVRGVTFLDAGLLGDLDPIGAGVQQEGGVRVSAGVGVNWNSPFGPLRFLLGFPLKKRDYDETRTFDFSIGTNF